MNCEVGSIIVYTKKDTHIAIEQNDRDLYKRTIMATCFIFS